MYVFAGILKTNNIAGIYVYSHRKKSTYTGVCKIFPDKDCAKLFTTKNA